jgi:mannose-6-phosphate isomerase-like protein (cupin superfamily)
MRVSKQDIPVKIDVPGAVARQTGDFGDPAGLGPLAGEYLSLGAGTDIAPLLQGLEHDACSSPHWGYVISGEAVVTFTDGTVETPSGGDLFYWPPGHSVRVVADAELILFSPRHEHARVMDHMLNQMAQA